MRKEPPWTSLHPEDRPFFTGIPPAIHNRQQKVLKGQSPRSKPLTVLKILGNWTYRPSGGQTWDARKLKYYLEPEAPLRHHHDTAVPYMRRS
ncbi:hypothetical protein PoB_006632300 [Plakobranchus ocellatus]|uniref:Uncharacterized protein n=1 Tax=Plakobranchus ocellatus TaxID=259542 RepID=A0AAV4D6Y7_9GAST|nr:hypothetical protein PoB_006632300 [Plakobranchus ocellatus]